MALIIPEKRIAQISGRAIPKPANDQNTDDIMPARFLKEITFKNMGRYVYNDECVNAGDAHHPFNTPKYAGGNILLAGANYGCGSSREHAPQGLYRFGIRAIVAESFAEIFAGNSAMIGLVPVTASREDVSKLIDLVQEDSAKMFVVDLANKVVRYNSPDIMDSQTIPIDIPEGRRQAFLNGTWDSMAVLQQNPEDIERVRKSLPYISQ